MTQLSYREDLDAMVITVEGQMSSDEHRRALEAFVCNEHFHPNMGTIWDLRRADLCELSSDDIRETVAAAIQSAEWRGTYWKPPSLWKAILLTV